MASLRLCSTKFVIIDCLNRVSNVDDVDDDVDNVDNVDADIDINNFLIKKSSKKYITRDLKDSIRKTAGFK